MDPDWLVRLAQSFITGSKMICPGAMETIHATRYRTNGPDERKIYFPIARAARRNTKYFVNRDSALSPRVERTLFERRWKRSTNLNSSIRAFLKR